MVIFGVLIGDLAAGAIGYRYGAHRYETSALFTTKTYTRSLEGSACIFLTTLIVLLLVADQVPATQLVAALILLPLALTVAEARSPHTWDEPVMTLVGTMVCLGIVTAFAT